MCLQAPGECDGALAAVEEYIESGKEPDREKLFEFLRGLAIRHLLDLLTESERELLRASTLFQVPVPLGTLEYLAQELGLLSGHVSNVGPKDNKKFCGGPGGSFSKAPPGRRRHGQSLEGERLLGFGLWEPFMDMVNPKETAAAIHALARPKVSKLSEEEVSQLAGLVVRDLFERWGGKESKNRPYAAEIELTRLALAARATSVLAAAADYAVLALRKRNQFKEAAKIAGETIRVMDEAKTFVPLRLLGLASEVSHQIGDIENAKAYISRALGIYKGSEEKDIEEYAHALITYSRMLVQSGEPNQALSHLEDAKTILQSDRFLKERAVVLGDIARIQVDRGQVEEALKLHQEELKVYEELGDRRSRAVTLGDIARIQASKEELDKALKCLEESGKIFEELGNIDSKAGVLWDLAQVELQKESVETAFQYLTESYAIFRKIGRLDGICIVGLYLGQILCQAGQTEEGLKILERSREGFGKLGWKEDAAQAQELIERFTG
jgi:tetratricopeptide (TPR) repeat protein